MCLCSAEPILKLAPATQRPSCQVGEWCWVSSELSQLHCRSVQHERKSKLEQHNCKRQEPR
jgi:hypothetical protein